MWLANWKATENVFVKTPGSDISFAPALKNGEFFVAYPQSMPK